MDINEFITKFAGIVNITNVSSLTPETDFHDLDEWSSLTAVKVIAFLDEEMDKEVSIGEINECFSLEDLYNL